MTVKGLPAHTVGVKEILTSSMIKDHNPLCEGSSLKSLDVALILATNALLLPCRSAADTSPTAYVNEGNKEPCRL